MLLHYYVNLRVKKILEYIQDMPKENLEKAYKNAAENIWTRK